MQLEPGSPLGSYQIVAPLGAGGMGEVYRARDPKLDREVAIKVLPEGFAENQERLARFEREAKSLAALNHPNVATVHGFEKEGDTHFLVMELVEGQDLSERIARGPIRVDEAIPLFVQVAEGLEAAHEKGIVHRDLKPANIMVSAEGRVKILDFGLAKAMEAPAAAGDVDMSHSPTMTAAATMRGEIMGTAAYMSPEQATGQAVDPRTDIWAFGMCLFEALTGTQPHQAEDATRTLASVLTAEPDYSSLPGHLPGSVGAFLQRCLAKDRRQRVQHMGDVRLSLEGAFEPVAPSLAPPRARTTVLPWLVAIGASALALALALQFQPPSESATRPIRRFSIDIARGTELPRGIGRNVAIDPQGETIVYAGRGENGRGLYRRRLSEFGWSPISGSQGAAQPLFSPDGEWIAFNEQSVTSVLRIPAAGGERFSICGRLPGAGAARAPGCAQSDWSTEGLLFEIDRKVYFMSQLAGEPELRLGPMPERGVMGVGRSQFLPSGGAILVDLDPFEFGGIGVYSPGAKELIEVTDYGFDPFWSATGHILFGRVATLFAVPFDPVRLEVQGPATPVLAGVRIEAGGSVQAAVSDNGTLVYLPADAVGVQLVWVDSATGLVDSVIADGRFFRAPRISDDGQKIAVQVIGEEGSDIWVYEGTTPRPLTSLGSAKDPLWRRDGSITFSSRLADSFAIHTTSSDGRSEPKTLMVSDLPISPESWSPDGRYLVFREDGTSRDLYMTDLAEPGSRLPLVVEEGNSFSAELSPSGRWLAYISERTGTGEVYVRAFPGPGPELKVSDNGGQGPVWGRDDTELYFKGLGGTRMFFAELNLDSSQKEIRPLFDASHYWDLEPRAHYDRHPGTESLVMLRQASPTAQRQTLRVVENWGAELQRLAPKDD